MDSENTGGGRMRIGVDAGCLGVLDNRLRVGVYNFAKNLLIATSKLDNKNTYLLYSFHPIDTELMGQLGNNFINIIVQPSKGWMKVWVPLRIWRDGIDVFLCFGQAVPAFLPASVKTIGYIYDIAFEKFPQYYIDSYNQLHTNTTQLIQKSDHIITLSEASKRDIEAFYSVPPQKVTGIHLGVRPFVRQIEGKKGKEKYFLFVGALKKGKNVVGTIKAFAAFCALSKEKFVLKIVGGDKWLDPEIGSTLESLPKNVLERVQVLGFVGDDEMHQLYSYATALLAPSYYEGFGLPVVEAMSVGCPVIVSERGSLPEIVSKAGFIFDPDDSEAIGQQMYKLSKDSTLRLTYKKKSIERAKRFTWERCAKETLQKITDIASK